MTNGHCAITRTSVYSHVLFEHSKTLKLKIVTLVTVLLSFRIACSNVSNNWCLTMGFSLHITICLVPVFLIPSFSAPRNQSVHCYLKNCCILSLFSSGILYHPAAFMCQTTQDSNWETPPPQSDLAGSVPASYYVCKELHAWRLLCILFIVMLEICYAHLE